MEEGSIESFKEQLDKSYSWPALYTFKFIVPKGKESDIKALFVQHMTREKASANGNYISITADIMAPSSDAIIKLYIAANTIEGVIAL